MKTLYVITELEYDYYFQYNSSTNLGIVEDEKTAKEICNKLNNQYHNKSHGRIEYSYKGCNLIDSIKNFGEIKYV